LKNSKVKFDFNDFIILIGWLIAISGIWLIYQPAAYIVAGLSILYVGLTGGNKKTGD
jgi:hypothetical protein